MKFKKNISVILAVVMLIYGNFIWVSATNQEIQPLYNNTLSTDVSFPITDSGIATVRIKVTGYSGVTKSITVTSHIERKSFGLFWIKVNNGLSNDEWVDTSSSYLLNASHSLQLEKSGEYRAVVKFVISGSGGADDTFNQIVYSNYG